MASNISYNSYFGYYGIGGWINASNNNNIMYQHFWNVAKTKLRENFVDLKCFIAKNKE